MVRPKNPPPPLIVCTALKELVDDIGGEALLQLGQTLLEFLKLFPHFHEEILKDFVFGIHQRVLGDLGERDMKT